MKRASAGHESYEHLLTCLICHTLFDDHDHQPKFLPCHHTFCKDCLRRSVAQTGDEIECPSCHKSATIPAAGVAALQTNFYAKYIQSLVYGCVGSSTGWVSDCTRHPGRHLLHFCKDCAVSICDVCLQERGCSRHRRDLLTAVMERCRCDMDAAFSETSALIESKKVELERLLKLLASEKDDALIKIESTFEQHVHALTRRATLLKNKVIGVYNECVAKLDADLEDVATGITCIVSLKEHYEPMISRGDVADAEKGLEELRDVHRNLSERIQPRVDHIVFEEKHGADGFRDCVKDLGRVVSKPGEFPPVKPCEEVVEDQSPRCDRTRVAGPKFGDDVVCDKPGVMTDKCKTIQSVVTSIGVQCPVPNDSSSTSFKTEVSVNIRNSLPCTAVIEKKGQVIENPAVCSKETSVKRLQTGPDVTDCKLDGSVDPKLSKRLNEVRTDVADRIPDASLDPKSSKKSLNTTFSIPAVASRQEVSDPADKATCCALVGQPGFPKLHTSTITGRCVGDSCGESGTEPLPQVTLTLNLDSLRAVSIRSENCSLAEATSSVSSIPPLLSTYSSSSAESDDTVSAESEELKAVADAARRCKAHKSYDEPRLRLELGYETSDVEDGSASPSRQMSRSDFWLMMSSSVESNLSEHDLIVGELSGEQTSL